MKKFPIFVFVCFISTTLFAQIDYNSEIQPIFTNNCNSCHSTGQNSFNSSSYSAVIGSASPSGRYNSKHVIPNDAISSPLIDKIEASPQFGSRMPQGGQLSSGEINKIKQWINEGALEEVATSNEDEITAPTEFKLLGNYPNPFNPSTTIQFQLPVTSDFQITVYNANGQLVKLINGKAGAGIKEQSVDLTNQSSGVYFYRIRVSSNGISNLIDSGKMTLIK